MAAYSNDTEKAHGHAHTRNSEFEMEEVYNPQQPLRTPSLYSFNDSTLYEPDHVYDRSSSPYGYDHSPFPYDNRSYDSRSPFPRSPYNERSSTPNSGLAFTHHSYSSTARLAPEKKYLKHPVVSVFPSSSLAVCSHFRRADQLIFT